MNNKKIEVVRVENEQVFKTVLEKDNFGYFIFCNTGYAQLQIDLKKVDLKQRTVIY